MRKVGIFNKDVHYNPSVDEIYKLALTTIPANPHTKQSVITSTGALAAYSHFGTGRVPAAKRIVKEKTTEKDIWWGDINIPFSEKSFLIQRDTAINYLNNARHLYIIDGYGGWDPVNRYKVRVYCTRPYHALFMRNMLIRPTEEQLKTEFSKGIDYEIFNAGEFDTSPLIDGVATERNLKDSGGKACVALNFAEKQLVILGSQYAGEMKKGFFTVAHYVYPT